MYYLNELEVSTEALFRGMCHLGGLEVSNTHATSRLALLPGNQDIALNSFSSIVPAMTVTMFPTIMITN